MIKNKHELNHFEYLLCFIFYIVLCISLVGGLVMSYAEAGICKITK